MHPLRPLPRRIGSPRDARGNQQRITLGTTAGAGATSGTGTVYKNGIQRDGEVIRTRILTDLTGLASSTTDLAIIGVGASAAHLGRIVATESGTIIGGTVTCLEVPAGGVTDIDVYAATEATGVFDSLVTDLTETAMVTSGAVWTLGLVRPVVADSVAANAYIYLAAGTLGVPGTYTAGRFLIELVGY